MVQWKGEIDRDKSGRKAALLDEVSELNVPNFFTLTKQDVKKLIGNSRTPEQVLNTEFSSDILDEIKSEYKQIGMSSEVREASGKAKSLVGGQRDTGRVSIRVSNDRKGIYDFELNVGISDLEESLKEVIASYYHENDSGVPALIIQKMVEPGYTGAAVNNYLGDNVLIEAVEGLGISLEEGVTSPTTYLINRGNIVDENEPESQIKITRNPMNGQHRRKRTSGETQISRSKILEIAQELEDKSFSVKFVYKRGTFYVVDVFKTEKNYSRETPSLKGIRVSNGEIEGRIGREIRFSEQTKPPEEYHKALISRKGGFTSKDAQKARKEEKPAVFSYTGDLNQGEKIEIPENQTEPVQHREETETIGRNSFLEAASQKQKSLSTSVSATEVLPIDGEERSVHLSPPFGQGYSIGREGENAIPSKGYLTNYSDLFAFNGEKAVLDARKLPREGLENAMEYLEADLKILLVERPDQQTVRRAVEERFDVIATQIDREALEKAVLREEKRFIMDNLAD